MDNNNADPRGGGGGGRCCPNLINPIYLDIPIVYQQLSLIGLCRFMKHLAGTMRITQPDLGSNIV